VGVVEGKAEACGTGEVELVEKLELCHDQYVWYKGYCGRLTVILSACLYIITIPYACQILSPEALAHM